MVKFADRRVEDIMNIKKNWGLSIGSDIDGILSQAIAERIFQISVENKIENQKEAERNKELEHLVMEHYSKNTFECEEFLYKLAKHDSEEKEQLYLQGLKDGIKLMREIFVL